LRHERAKKEHFISELTLCAKTSGMALLASNSANGAKLKTGDQVWGNQPVVNIPSVSRMKIKMAAPEADFKSINVGDSVVYSFDAMPENVGYGKITLKSSVETPSQQVLFFGGGVTVMYSDGRQPSRVKFFDIEGSLDSVQQLPEPGFSAHCRVILNCMKDTIVTPQVAVYAIDSMKVVFVRMKGGAYEMREVLTGASSMQHVVIDKGLKEGETLSLLRPASNLIRKRTPLAAADVAAAAAAADATKKPLTSYHNRSGEKKNQ